MVYQDFQDALTEITDFETHDAIFLEPEEIENNQNSQVSQQAFIGCGIHLLVLQCFFCACLVLCE